MRGKHSTAGRVRWAAVLASVAAICWGPSGAAQAQMGETAWLATSSFGHDALANCLAKAMWREFVTAPVVSAPPKRSAYVNLWPRVQPQPVDPVASFQVEPQPDGAMRIGWRRLTNTPAGANWDGAARTAASRCAANPG
ncbi:hypothetical protein [Reyranella sp. CPCC 100927]|uniref:hypothetical protein n=1 Tax=Reyranella sp. CPCC 100927 TaxID=2599616 RepID=UPI0011B7C8A9|nr:hypothetical protein [Reyranella sp. CPCC 100927]TWS95826.1 hypothetical protein FQU96_40140 [Reyranella sp. CPCC 100927]